VVWEFAVDPNVCAEIELLGLVLTPLSRSVVWGLSVGTDICAVHGLIELGVSP
jgi:hypothetical protein